jgi:hypothetical protein
VSKRFLYGAIDIISLDALAIGTSEAKIREFISNKADKNIKLFKVTIDLEKNYKVRLNIDGFSPDPSHLSEINAKMKKLWDLVYLFELDVSESQTEIYIFK